MIRKGTQFDSVLLVVLLTGIAFAHALERLAKMLYDADIYHIATQSLRSLAPNECRRLPGAGGNSCNAFTHHSGSKKQTDVLIASIFLLLALQLCSCIWFPHS